MKLPTLDELSLLSMDEAEVAIVTALPNSIRLVFVEQPTHWQLRLIGADGTLLWEGTSPDRRALLFDGYGQVLLNAGYKPKSPVWQRRQEVRIPERFGVKAYQGDVKIPDPEDLKPEELLHIYGIHTKKGSVR